MRAIDADALWETIKDHEYTLFDRWNTTDKGMFSIGIKQAIDEQQTIDADTLPVIWEGRFVGVAKNDLDKAPTLDVRPNIHAHWIVTLIDEGQPDGGVDATCSNCGHMIWDWEDERVVKVENRFCPYCGAEMDEVVDMADKERYTRVTKCANCKTKVSEGEEDCISMPKCIEYMTTDEITEAKPTNFEKWRDGLTIDDFENYLVEMCDAWDCEFLCPAYSVCENHLCRHPEAFIKWANQEVVNNG